MSTRAGGGRDGPGRRKNWDALREKLRRSAVDHGMVRSSPEAVSAVLDERARALARVPDRPPGASEVIEVVTFNLADECYALETRFVRRIEQTEAPSPIPGAPDHLIGLVNLHGEILPVFDLRALLGITRPEATGLSRVIVVGDAIDEFGIRADATHLVVTLRTDDVFASSDSNEGFGRLGIRGMTRDALVVLDGEALLRDNRLFVNLSETTGE